MPRTIDLDDMVEIVHVEWSTGFEIEEEEDTASYREYLPLHDAFKAYEGEQMTLAQLVDVINSTRDGLEDAELDEVDLECHVLAKMHDAEDAFNTLYCLKQGGTRAYSGDRTNLANRVDFCVYASDHSVDGRPALLTRPILNVRYFPLEDIESYAECLVCALTDGEQESDAEVDLEPLQELVHNDVPLVATFCERYAVAVERVGVTGDPGAEEPLYFFSSNVGEDAPEKGYTATQLQEALDWGEM
ncbi:hypothetical protein KY362_00870 [Candidatus Woesearchaeota archaeon]|nr:hypothetical protein [Candidatus Woesearchaeota archaeon]